MQINDCKTHDGETIYVYYWGNVKGQPKGIVQIMHGMNEHMARYDEFACRLNAEGYFVVGDDHRGHGKTAGSIERIGKRTMGDMFGKTVKDAIFITNKTKEVHKDLPYFVLGHSYGSLLLQRYLELNSRGITAAIIVGSACMKGSLDVLLGSLVAKIGKKDGPAKLISSMTFDSYNKRFNGEHWISRDKAICDAYLADPYCIQVFSNGFYRSLFSGLKTLYKKNELQKIDIHIPLLLLAGNKDCFSKNAKLVEKLYNLYTNKLNMDNVQKKIYDGARHEVLNEINREEVYLDVLEFLAANCQK